MSEPSQAPADRRPPRAERAYVRGVFRFLFGVWLFGLGLTGAWFLMNLTRLTGLAGRAIGFADFLEPLQYAAILGLLGLCVWLARLGIKALYPHAFDPVRRE